MRSERTQSDGSRQSHSFKFGSIAEHRAYGIAYCMPDWRAVGLETNFRVGQQRYASHIANTVFALALTFCKLAEQWR